MAIQPELVENGQNDGKSARKGEIGKKDGKPTGMVENGQKE